MAELSGQVGEVRFTLEVKRKETGKVETFEMVGFLDEAKLKEYQDGGNAQYSSTERGD